MSGIAGIIHFDGKPVEPGQVEAMTAAMHYRGPDGINHWRHGNVALGQCMLRTTPESLEETQPLTNEDESLVLVIDGRVDNWKELRRELLGKGAVLRTLADAELVLRAYEVWGCDCLPHIDGDFALLIWDAWRQVAFCARDRIGNKPLHYHWNGRTLAFSSELHPILELPWVEERPNNGMLAEFLAWDVESLNETLWEGVMRLAPAHAMSVTSLSACPKRYWTPDIYSKLPFTKDEEYFERYRELLTDSVRRLSRSHRSLACEVSGGLDSSALFCVADQLRGADQLQAPGLEGYTLAFMDQSEANEMVYARAVGTHLGVHIHEIPPALLPLSWYENNARNYRDFAGFPNGAMSENLWKRASQDGSCVLFNGVGGDEWLSGSRTYYAEELSQLHIGNLYKCLKADISAYGAGQAATWLLRYGLFCLLPNVWQSNIKSIVRSMLGGEAVTPFWLAPQMQSVLTSRINSTRDQRSVRSFIFGQHRLQGILDNGFRVLGGEMTERLVVRSGLEVRRPFHSVQLVDFAFATPERLRMSHKVNKYVHLEAMKGLLPQQIHERRDKAEFSSVFRAQLDQMGQLMSEAIPQCRSEWLSVEGMRKLYAIYQDDTTKGFPLWILWSVYMCHNVTKR